MPCEGTVADEFQTLIRPAYYKKMNRKVASLTGIKDAILKEQGKPFPEAMQAFHDWCGEDSAFLTWGFDDIVILKENLTLYGMDTAWVDKWYNAQLIFNAQTDGSSAQKALGSAMQIMGIEPTRPAHDALGDAYHTALICSRLRLAEGIDAYEKAAKEHENGFHGAELPGCVARHVSHGYADKAQALAAMAQEESVCPCLRRGNDLRQVVSPARQALWRQWRRVKAGRGISRARAPRGRTRTGRFAPIGWSTARTARQRRATAA